MSLSYSPSIRRIIVSSCTLLALICIFAGGRDEVQAEEKTSVQTSQLKALRALVAENEALFSLIKMRWTVRIDPGLTESELESMRDEMSGRRSGPPYTHYVGTWAQDDIRQHLDTDFFSGPNRWERGDIRVVDGEVTIEGYKPDFMIGAINHIEKFKAINVPIMLLGLKPFNSQHKLSELILPEYASIHEKREVIDGRETYVVDIQKPSRPGRVARIWIDCERGAALRLEYYSKDPVSAESVLTSEINSVKLYQLANGGWFPVAGNRALNRRSPVPRVLTEYIRVDVNSVTIRREDIPDSLFTIEFPEGARIYNAITGTTTEGGWSSSYKVDKTIDRSVEALIEEDSELQELISDQLLDEPVVKSPQEAEESPPNEPTQATEESTRKIYPIQKPGLSNLVWILLSSFVAAIAVTVIVLIFRRSSTYGKGGKPDKNSNVS